MSKFEISICFLNIGGYGTLEELLEVITWAQLGIHDKPVISMLTKLIPCVMPTALLSAGNILAAISWFKELTMHPVSTLWRLDCSMLMDTIILCSHLLTKLWRRVLLVPVHATLFYPLQQQKSWWRNWRYAKETISKLGRFGRSNSSN